MFPDYFPEANGPLTVASHNNVVQHIRKIALLNELCASSDMLPIDYQPPLAPKSFSSLMPSSSPRFVGRENILEQLDKFFKDISSISPRRIFILYGLGGAGKTQIILKFLESVSDR